LLEKIGGKLARKVANKIVTYVSKKSVNLLNGLAGRGTIASGKADDVIDTVHRLETISHYRFKALKEGDIEGLPEGADPVGDLFEDFADHGASAMNETAEQLGVLDHMEVGIVEYLRNELEDIVFEQYYTTPWVPSLHVPVPDEIGIPDIDVAIDIPDEDLPWGLDRLVPDDIGLDLETPDIPLPEVPVLSDIHEVREGIGVDTSDPSGVDTSLGDSIGSLFGTLRDGDLARQEPAARDRVRNVMAGGIDSIDDVARGVIDGVENLRSKVGELQDMIGMLISLALAGAVIAFVTGVGSVALVSAAVALAKIGLVMMLFSALLDIFAVVVGVGTTLYYANLHHVGATGLLDDDLGGVPHG
jgi:hypothetical protein